MTRLLSVHTVAFTFLGYPMSWVELAGTVLYLWSVWLVAERRLLTWPVGIASVLLYLALFWQIRLYADAMEQVYYLGACTYGWVRWAGAPREGGVVRHVRLSPAPVLAAALLLTAAASAGAGALLCRVHVLAPGLFPEPASFPWLDAATTVMSFAAMWLTALGRIESWIYWIAVDVAGIGLYWVKEVRFVALLYLVLLALAVRGLRGWVHASRDPGRPRRP